MNPDSRLKMYLPFKIGIFQPAMLVDLKIAVGKKILCIPRPAWLLAQLEAWTVVLVPLLRRRLVMIRNVGVYTQTSL